MQLGWLLAVLEVCACYDVSQTVAVASCCRVSEGVSVGCCLVAKLGDSVSLSWAKTVPRGVLPGYDHTPGSGPDFWQRITPFRARAFTVAIHDAIYSFKVSAQKPWQGTTSPLRRSMHSTSRHETVGSCPVAR